MWTRHWQGVDICDGSCVELFRSEQQDAACDVWEWTVVNCDTENVVKQLRFNYNSEDDGHAAAVWRGEVLWQWQVLPRYREGEGLIIGDVDRCH